MVCRGNGSSNCVSPLQQKTNSTVHFIKMFRKIHNIRNLFTLAFFQHSFSLMNQQSCDREFLSQIPILSWNSSWREFVLNAISDQRTGTLPTSGFWKLFLLIKQQNPLKVTEKVFCFHLKHIPSTGNTSQLPSPTFIHQLLYHVNINHFKVFGVIP